MKNMRIEFVFTNNYNESEPNNGFSEEKDSIVTDGVYDFEDYLMDNGVSFEEENGVYFVTEDDERTGEAYMVVNETETDEEIRG